MIGPFMFNKCYSMLDDTAIIKGFSLKGVNIYLSTKL